METWARAWVESAAIEHPLNMSAKVEERSMRMEDCLCCIGKANSEDDCRSWLLRRWESLDGGSTPRATSF